MVGVDLITDIQMGGLATQLRVMVVTMATITGIIMGMVTIRIPMGIILMGTTITDGMVTIIEIEEIPIIHLITIEETLRITTPG